MLGRRTVRRGVRLLGFPCGPSYGSAVQDIRSWTRDELNPLFAGWQQPGYRVDQLLDWLYRRRATSWEVMSNLPKALRERLAQTFALRPLELVRTQGSRDTTQKFLWRLQDQAMIESVLIPANPALYGDAADRHTLCISTQVGCAYGCKFCASGLEGWKRNLTADEIVEQVLAVERTASGGNDGLFEEGETEPAKQRAGELAPAANTPSRTPAAAPPRLVDNVVVMGMGEPLANYDHLLKALTILNAPWGGGIGARKITVSTSGLVPQIRKLAEEPFQFRLAISLHGARDEVRDRIMPVNRKHPLADLTAACEHYQRRKGKMLTLEYILIAAVNDDLKEVPPLARLARRLHAKVNLIPYNSVEGLPWKRPGPDAQEAFLARLKAEGVVATLRREKGHDIDAACGQLRLKTERELSEVPAGQAG
jgi:23S rRNA (adenine2503-C2)-methyltransferase